MIFCGLHENPRSSAAVAYAVWLAQQLHMPLRLAPAYPRNELLAAAEAHRARLLVVACQDSDSSGNSRDGAQSLVKESPRPVIALSKRAALPWRAPHRAQRNARPLIVAGVDGSEASLAAAAEAADLTERMDSWLMLVHARSDQVPHGPTRFSVDNRLAGTDDGACRRLAQSVLPRLGRANGEAGARELFGDPVEALEAVASAEAAAMIAVGSRGLEPDRLVPGGSVSAALIRDASRPVLVLSPRAVARTISRLGAGGAG
jgi:nucleotide-binding universal stress UspA family protein